MTKFMIGFISVLSLAGCERNSRVGSTGADTGPMMMADGGTPDASPPPDSGMDAMTASDAGSDDAAISDAGSADAGPLCAMPCDASSCGARVCGRSDCGFNCGECRTDQWCGEGFRPGTGCLPGVGPGGPCIDPFGQRAHEGDRSFRICPTDPTRLQGCECSGGGPDACFASPSDPCIDRCLAPQPGALCDDDRDCGGLTCHRSIRRCGVACDRGTPGMCPAGTVCHVPSGLAGICLPTCATCDGTGCDNGFVCRPTETGGGLNFTPFSGQVDYAAC